MQHNVIERVNVNKDEPSLIIEPPSPVIFSQCSTYKK